VRTWFHRTAAVALASLTLVSVASAADTKVHRLLIQVDQNDPAVMNLALNNATNVIEHYRSKGQEVAVDVVTYGPGLHMLRADTSPVQDRIKQLKNVAFPSTI
jgi:intracellular sulfur oxidation DsrE/DsrF family protein